MAHNHIELLSPVSSFDTLRAAINAGADAIYFGVEQLNMRARSANQFSLKDIQQISAICQEEGIRSFITLNTVIYGHDLQLLRSILKEVKKHKINAVICSDFAVIELCNTMDIPIHLSTQTNVSNFESVVFFSKFADAIVLARELSLKQVTEIVKKIKRQNVLGKSGHLLDIEVFVHGALCMAVSGKCYLSLHTHNASANRGACVQNCRRTYNVTDVEGGDEFLVEDEYIMSAKDLCTIGILDQIIKSGVKILKIEGRSKGADYVYTVTRCYREAIDAIKANEYTEDKIDQWLEELSTVYNRGFWEGYYMGRRLGEWSDRAGSIATERKVYVGKGSKYYPRIGVGEFDIETGTVHIGDTLMVIGPNHGMVREQMDTLFVNGIENPAAIQGDKITFPISSKVTTQDKLYKVVAAADD